MDPKPTKNDAKPALVGAEALLRELFPDESARPSLRWLKRLKAKRLVPFKKVAGRVFFDPQEVRRSWDHNFSVDAVNQTPDS